MSPTPKKSRATAASVSAGPVEKTGNLNDTTYEAYVQNVQARFSSLVADKPLFKVDVNPDVLWNAYLAAIDPGVRQHNNCNCCKSFMRRFGTVVVMDAEGKLTSPIWDPTLAPADIREAVALVKHQVETAKVDNVFVTDEVLWGNNITGIWRHMALYLPIAKAFKIGVLDAHQKMAEHRENFKCINLALAEFKPKVLDQALTILRADAVKESEKFVAWVQWLIDLKQTVAKHRGPLGRNMVWRAVATAPAGWCTPRSSMIGTLLEDLEKGLPFEVVQRKFNEKMHPLQYQRPSAPPAAGNIKQAEEAIAKLGLAPSLERRFATLGEIPTVWQPQGTQAPPSTGGVFGHLQPKGQAPVTNLNLPSTKMTWEKFTREVLPEATKIELYVPRQRNSFSALVTAVHADAPPLLQWDSPENRNPVSWYFYNGGSAPSQWNLPHNAWVPVLGISMKPNTWNGGFTHHGQAVMFVLEGAQDLENRSLALFPNLLRSELHGVRATIEAFSQTRKLEIPGGALASGLMVSQGDTWDVTLKVTRKGATQQIVLDRWD